MVTGRDLIEHGWPEGPTIGPALAAARKLRAAGIIHPTASKGGSQKPVCGKLHSSAFKNRSAFG